MSSCKWSRIMLNMVTLRVWKNPGSVFNHRKPTDSGDFRLCIMQKRQTHAWGLFLCLASFRRIEVPPRSWAFVSLWMLLSCKAPCTHSEQHSVQIKEGLGNRNTDHTQEVPNPCPQGTTCPTLRLYDSAEVMALITPAMFARTRIQTSSEFEL